jgi:hypothetical protein
MGAGALIGLILAGFGALLVAPRDPAAVRLGVSLGWWAGLVVCAVALLALLVGPPPRPDDGSR